MTASVKKEFGVLLTPWITAMSAALLLPVITTLTDRMPYRYIRVLPPKLVVTLAGVCILVACLAMAGITFGSEFHHRTLGLMLAQPVKRSRIWWSKMLPLFGAYISVGMAFISGQFLAGAAWGSSYISWTDSRLLWFTALQAGVLCSCAFWTLQSRSIIGGMVLPLAMQALPAGIIAWIVSSEPSGNPEELESRLILALCTGAIVYCALFIYLGWRKLSRLQWREGSIGESALAAAPIIRRKGYRPSAPCGPWTSLLGKELRLHRPVFFLAALFVVCWFAAFALRALRPAWESQFAAIFGSILVMYLMLAWLLSGCISLGEEKLLGTWGWHLTLSVSGARQWAVKISFAILVTLISGILVPALAWLAVKSPNILSPVGYWMRNGISPALLALLAVIPVTVLSFWSVTMFGTVVRAVLFSMSGTGILFTGGVIMMRIGGETLLFQGICSRLMVEFQLSHSYYIYFPSDRFTPVGWLVGLSLLLMLLLRQSYVHRRHEPSTRVIFKCSLILILSLLLPLWLSSDIPQSYMRASAELQVNLEEAISKLPTSFKKEAFEKSRPISLEEIDGTGMLSPDTKHWLRNTNIRIIEDRTGSMDYDPRYFYFRVETTFPNGRHFETWCH